MAEIYQVDADGLGERLDVFITSVNESYSRSIWQKLIAEGQVSVNNEVKDSKYKLKEGDVVRFEPPKKPTAPEFEVIYEDDDVIVINKPSGVLTHLKSDLESEATVASYIADRTTAEGGNRAGIVHRLDRDTSGIIITAKNEPARAHLSRQFADRNTKKWYLCVVEGEFDGDQTEINEPIARHPKKPATFYEHDSGKPASTKVHKLRAEKSRSTLLLNPLTGRTHQLRVHLSSAGYPIIGDSVYNKSAKFGDYLYLHAWQLEVTLPNSERKHFIASLEPAMSKYINDEDLERARNIIASSNKN